MAPSSSSSSSLPVRVTAANVVGRLPNWFGHQVNPLVVVPDVSNQDAFRLFNAATDFQTFSQIPLPTFFYQERNFPLKDLFSSASSSRMGLKKGWVYF